MFDGKRFFPETGTPIRKIARRRTLLAVCEPEPLAVATWSEKSLTRVPEATGAGRASGCARVVGIGVAPPAAGAECASAIPVAETQDHTGAGAGFA